jgi:UDP-N-acetylglucosamine 2-epimerase (non-hydrolysing)
MPLAARGLRPSLILTGQHPLDPGAYGRCEYRTVQLHCPGEMKPGAHAQRVAAAMAPLMDPPPHLLVVQGDTSSALGGARAGFTSKVPVAHVEAGLRTHDPLLPWPEERYRTLIDARADLLFAPTDGAAANLRGEACQARSMTQVILRTMPCSTSSPIYPSLGVRESRRVLVTCHRRENWGDGLRSIANALVELAVDGLTAIDIVLPPNAHVATTLTSLFGRIPNITLQQPCSHRDLVERMRNAGLVLSEPGGMQEEAPALRFPMLILRDKTERPEGIASGNMRLVGTATGAIVAEARRLLTDPLAYAAMSRPAFPYGDGKAAPRIAEIIERWLAS